MHAAYEIAVWLAFVGVAVGVGFFLLTLAALAWDDMRRD